MSESDSPELLRQPGSFERLVPFKEVADANDLPALEGDDHGELMFHRHPASLSDTGDLGIGDDDISSRREVPRLGTKSVELTAQ